LVEKIKSSVYADKINIVNNEFATKDALIFTFDPLVKTKFHEPFTIE
jgi:hypothetical protein